MNKSVKRLLAGPYIVWMIGFTIIPLLLIVFYGLTDKGGAFTLANVLSIGTPEHAKALFLSLGLSLLSTLICLVLAYPLAMVLRRKNIGQGSFMVFIFILPMWMNFLLRTLAWQTLLEKNGVINGILNFLHLPNIAIINTPWAIILGMVYNFLPFMILPIYNVLAKIDDNTINAAKDLGANEFQTLTHIWDSAQPARNHQRNHDGFRPCPDHFRYLEPSGRQQNPADWQCHRAGIYKGQQLEPGFRSFPCADDIHFTEHGPHCKIR